MASIIRVFDVETSGLKASEGHAVVEAAAWDVSRDQDGKLFCRPFLSTFVNPCRAIPASVSGIHHITDRDVVGAPLWIAVAGMLEDDPEPVAYCAHRASFEAQWFQPDGIPMICTYKVSLRVYPDMETHSNQGLRYALGLNLDPVLSFPPHRSSPDAYVTAHILMHFINAGTSVREMIQISREPALLTKIGFGEHFGKRWSECPDSYLKWILTKDFDEDTAFTARSEMARRNATSLPKGDF